jgi:hypothetical protein
MVKSLRVCSNSMLDQGLNLDFIIELLPRSYTNQANLKL